eukprot:TRINITY_DN2409_c0_g1_i4.p1 TRINITY_DN2409_c0_g1~~TRINITY_DN2409_c0_g1_i4.p1  ORF type:complete len:272 (-),score=9.81 TRINITY_DN2409_c0_g1_i4:63-878(-)
MIRSGAVNNYDAIIKATTEGKTVHCSLIHKGPCLGFCWGKASNVFKNNFFTYFMVHALPILLSKQRMREFVKNPGPNTLKLIKNLAKSMLFICGSAFLMRYFICLSRNALDIRSTMATGFLGLAFTTFLEPDGRRQEFAIFTMPKFLDALWNFFRLRTEMAHTLKYGENLFFGLAMGLLVYFYNQGGNSIRPMYRKMLKHLWGDCQCTVDLLYYSSAIYSNTESLNSFGYLFQYRGVQCSIFISMRKFIPFPYLHNRCHVFTSLYLSLIHI